MKELQDSIEKIQIKRRALRTVMNHDPLIHKFPPEIASRVFIQYAPTSDFFSENSKNCPLYLGAVCQKWRQLAWATPQLWSSLRIGRRSDWYAFRRNSEDLPQLVTEWLERSSSLPLAIDFHMSLFGNPGDKVYSEVIDILNNLLDDGMRSISTSQRDFYAVFVVPHNSKKSFSPIPLDRLRTSLTLSIVI